MKINYPNLCIGVLIGVLLTLMLFVIPNLEKKVESELRAQIAHKKALHLVERAKVICPQVTSTVEVESGDEFRG